MSKHLLFHIFWESPASPICGLSGEWTALLKDRSVVVQKLTYLDQKFSFIMDRWNDEVVSIRL